MDENQKIKKRKKIRFDKPNDLFIKWLEEWYIEAATKGSKIQYAFGKALVSLKRYPLPLKSGKECLILEHFGPSICIKLDRRLAEYKKEHPERFPNEVNQSDSSTNEAHPSSSNDIQMITNSPTPLPQKKIVKSPRKSSYVPSKNSPAFAVFVAMHENGLECSIDDVQLQMVVKRLINKSYPDSCMDNLLQRGLITENSNSDRFTLTKEGKKVAEIVYAKYVLSQGSRGRDNEPNKVNEIKSYNSRLRDFDIIPLGSFKQNSSKDDQPDEIIDLDEPTDSVTNFLNEAEILNNRNSLNEKCHSSQSTNKNGSQYSCSQSSLSTNKNGSQESSSQSSLSTNKNGSQYSSSQSSLSTNKNRSQQSSSQSSLSTNKNGSQCSSSQSSLSTNKNGSQCSSSQNSQSDNQDSNETICMLPNTFEIFLVVDNHETGTRFTVETETLEELTKLGVKYEVKSLKVGDFTWIARDTYGNELVLPYIVERKRMDDFAQSIKDSRFQEQKFRLKKCGLSNLIYLVENYGSNLFLGLPLTSVLQAATNTEIIDGFIVKFTQSHADSMIYLQQMTTFLTSMYLGKTLMSCFDKHSISDNLNDSLLNLIKFKQFNQSANKSRNYKIKEMFIKQLVQLHGLSLAKAIVIAEHYPTPLNLINAFHSRGENLLVDLKYSELSRIGNAISHSLYQFYTRQTFT